jgi:predicted GNAT family acetyltransferase
MQVRAVSADDWKVWREIRLRSLKDAPDAFGSTYDREVGFTEAEWRDWLRGTALLVYDDGVPVAMGASFDDEPDETMIVAMWTAPEHRGRGAAKLVLSWLVRDTLERGRRPHLWVTKGNAARRLYEAKGFEPDGRTKELRPGINADHLIAGSPW